ncbi:unnamed protein product [Pedinophyceae sp. YPF-701]|nr:unnamed protein product [Pedinophyceae sp. YPF-701]
MAAGTTTAALRGDDAEASGQDFYIHGYSPEEQKRLLEQAEYWGPSILAGLPRTRPGELLFEVGVGVGAVLKLIASARPDLRLAGIDLEPRQVDAARRTLAQAGVCDRAQGGNAIVVGQAERLPLSDSSVDHCVMVWLLEHVADPLQALREAWRVLKPGGTLYAVETDYTTLVAFPDPSGAFADLRDTFVKRFDRDGRAVCGPNVGGWMSEAGFVGVRSDEVRSGVWSVAEQAPGAVLSHANYFLRFIEPEFDAMLRETPSISRGRLEEGAAAMRSAATHRDGLVGIHIWRVVGEKPQ